MPHLLIALAARSQLARLRGDLLPEVEAGLRAAVTAAGARTSWDGEGILVADCGTAARPVAALALRVLDDLRARRDDLFGFALVLLAAAADPDPALVRRLAGDALAREPQDALWIAPSAADAFAGVLAWRPGEGWLLVTGPGEPARPSTPTAAPPARPAAANTAGGWIRDTLVDRCLELLAGRLNDPESRTVVFVHGRPGAGKTTLLREASRRLGGDGPVLRAYPLFRRRTVLHPFLCGVDPAFLPEVPGLLSATERGAWEDLVRVFATVAAPEQTGRDAPGAVPDRVVTDFVQAYRLYARARVRRAARALVPGVIAFEDVEAWHPASREIAAALVDDLLAEPAAIPVVTSADAAPPPEFSPLEIAPLSVPPLGRREIRAYARALFPGLELPESVVRRLRGSTSGLPGAVAASLRCLARTGSIHADGAGHAWTQGREADLPSDAQAAAWRLALALPDGDLAILHALHLAAGLLDRGGLLEFLASAGFDRAAADRAIDCLVADGLADEDPVLAPAPAGLRRRIEERLGDAAARLTGRLADQLVGRWESGGFRREVLLFSFLARCGRAADARRVLPGILRRKLAERDTAGARAFSEPSRLVLAPEAGTDLGLVCAAARLRAAVQEDRLEEAGGLARDIARLAHAGGGAAAAAEAALASARYYLAVGDSSSSLDALKRGLAAAQEEGDRGAAAMREASQLMAATMLADGRLGEAGEYALLAEREAQEAGDRLDALRAGSLSASCSFVEGRLSRAAESAGAAARLAAELGQREEELFLAFLAARLGFLLGDVEGCAARLQRCLCLAELYRVDAAEPVLDAWLARSLAYAGAPAAGTARLERLEPTREVLLFRAEAALLAGDLEAAAAHADRGLAVAEATAFPPPHGGAWRDGFLAFEGRCYSLARPGVFLGRQLAALRGHLLARRGLRAEAARELGVLVRAVRPADHDPSLPVYLHWYAGALPEKGGEDDRLTVLARALKLLQERASRIDVPAERTAYLAANRWHRALMDEGRARRLA